MPSCAHRQHVARRSSWGARSARADASGRLVIRRGRRLTSPAPARSGGRPGCELGAPHRPCHPGPLPSSGACISGAASPDKTKREIRRSHKRQSPPSPPSSSAPRSPAAPAAPAARRVETGGAGWPCRGTAAGVGEGRRLEVPRVIRRPLLPHAIRVITLAPPILVPSGVRPLAYAGVSRSQRWLSSVAPFSTNNSTGRPRRPPRSLRSSITILATLTLAIP